jgi:aryl-phospho-beta-D-glucosidase BglC (GH1 family)
VAITGLHVQGNQVLNGSNQVVQLRGVNRSGTEYMCEAGGIFDGPSDQASIDAMKTWGINVVRIPLNEDCWLGINGQPAGGLSASQYRSAIVTFVNLLGSNNIAAVIDLQWAAPGTQVPNGNLNPMPDEDHSPAFWGSVAATFKGNDAVLFDLFNEPHPLFPQDSAEAWTCLRDGGGGAGGGGACGNLVTDANSGTPYTAAGTQELVNTIRAAGADNIIMVPGVQYTNSMTQWLPYKPLDSLQNLAASWHSYQGQICSDQNCFDTNVAPVAAQVPLIAGEIGEYDCQHAYIDPLMAWLDQHGANYLGWAWDTYDCGGFPALISNYDGTPTNFGIGLRDHLRQLAGL